MKNLTFILIAMAIAGCARSPMPVSAPIAPVAQAKAAAKPSDVIVSSMKIMAKRQLIEQDTNKDNVVSRSEWMGWGQDFDLGDRNRDNRLTLAEYEALMTSQL